MWSCRRTPHEQLQLVEIRGLAVEGDREVSVERGHFVVRRQGRVQVEEHTHVHAVHGTVLEPQDLVPGEGCCAQ